MEGTPEPLPLDHTAASVRPLCRAHSRPRPPARPIRNADLFSAFDAKNLSDVLTADVEVRDERIKPPPIFVRDFSGSIEGLQTLLGADSFICEAAGPTSRFERIAIEVAESARNSGGP